MDVLDHLPQSHPVAYLDSLESAAFKKRCIKHAPLSGVFTQVSVIAE